jgi:hypothetical protein
MPLEFTAAPQGQAQVGWPSLLNKTLHHVFPHLNIQVWATASVVLAGHQQSDLMHTKLQRFDWLLPAR